VLTADLVHARSKGAELCLVGLDAARRMRAHALASLLIETAKQHVGRSRTELVLALSGVPVGPREHRLKDGLAKLIEDRCEFDTAESAGPQTIRHDVFARASTARAALEPGGRFDRLAVIAAVARDRGTSVDAIERTLFADLRGAHVLARFDAPSAGALVTLYEYAQAQAVLLRAVKVTVDVRSSSAAGLRAFFRKLKFLRLLHVVERTDQGHRVTVDGPFSLFESVTKYGLQLALMLPLLDQCDSWRLKADVLWGKERTPLVFRLSGAAQAARAESPRLPDEVQALADGFAALGTEWRVSANTDILEPPGIGLCVPDLVFSRSRKGHAPERVYLEVMGYWSRAAVWKRVELVQAGLGERILFAVSSRLRVSEEVLEGDLPGALYVYKRTMSARAIAERLEALSR
jgi:predicted nuclease of restriction endonuclease-like RecB superfamily